MRLQCLIIFSLSISSQPHQRYSKWQSFLICGTPDSINLRMQRSEIEQLGRVVVISLQGKNEWLQMELEHHFILAFSLCRLAKGSASNYIGFVPYLITVSNKHSNNFFLSGVVLFYFILFYLLLFFLNNQTCLIIIINVLFS